MSATPCLTFKAPKTGDRSRCRACGGTREDHEGRKAPWTEAHRREALMIMLYAQREQVREGVKHLAAILYEDTETEEELRDALDAAFGFDPARIDREVKHVRDLAEGRKVRMPASERWEVAFVDSAQRETFDSDTPERNRAAAHRRAADWARAKVIHVVTRATRIRRAR